MEPKIKVRGCKLGRSCLAKDLRVRCSLSKGVHLLHTSYFGLLAPVKQLYQHLMVLMASLLPIAAGPTLAFVCLLTKPNPSVTIGGPKSESFTQKSSVLHFVDSAHLECSPHTEAICT